MDDIFETIWKFYFYQTFIRLSVLGRPFFLRLCLICFAFTISLLRAWKIDTVAWTLCSIWASWSYSCQNSFALLRFPSKMFNSLCLRVNSLEQHIFHTKYRCCLHIWLYIGLTWSDSSFDRSLLFSDFRYISLLQLPNTLPCINNSNNLQSMEILSTTTYTSSAKLLVAFEETHRQLNLISCV